MAIYMKFDGIKGSVTESKYKDQVELGSFQLGVGRHIDMHTGAGAERTAGLPNVSEITVTKLADASSTDMFKAAFYGEPKKCEIAVVVQNKGAPEEIVKWVMENTMISGWSISGAGDGNSLPSESLSLNFSKITQTTSSRGPDGKMGSPLSAGWDLSTNKKV